MELTTGSLSLTSGRPPLVVHGAGVLDETGGFTDGLDVRIEDGSIADVAPTVWTRDAEVVDATGLWLLPGVFDCHDHLAGSTLSLAEGLATPVSLWALEAARNAGRTLAAGVTFVRDLGGADAGIRDAFDRELVPGPRVQIADVMLSQTGGHDDDYFVGAGLSLSSRPGKPHSVVDGVENMRLAVRKVLRAGADWVKLATTGGLVSDHDQPLGAEFTFEEIKAAVDEARRKQTPVAAHAYGGDGLTNAIRAGVRSIEHGGFLTEEQARSMADRGCWLVPTLSAMRDVQRWAESGLLAPAQSRKILELDLDVGAAVRIAREYGVRLALGTDFITREQHGRNLEELVLMHDAGLSVEETLLAATRGGAELCGVAGAYGRIAPGFVFDAVLLACDPSDLRRLLEPGAVAAVFKAGAPVARGKELAARAPGLSLAGDVPPDDRVAEPARTPRSG